MQETVKMPYGKTRLTFTAPKGATIEILESKRCRNLPNAQLTLRKSLEKPLRTQPLSEIACGRKSACIVISDITRPVPNLLILGEILPILEKAGIPREKTTILIGTGTHRAAPVAEVRTLVGADTACRYRVVSHDCNRGNVRIGEITNPICRTKIPLEIDRLYVEADLKILTGLVEPHIFCGYSGGRKAILPGIASLGSIRRWHCPEIVAHRKSTPGVLQGNVAHRLTSRAAGIVAADFCVNVTLNRMREITGVFAGGVEQVFEAAVAKVESYVLTQPVAPAKVIVTSAAGWPLDLTFYQAIKGLVAVLPVFAKGGVVVLAAKCDEGLGDALFESLIRCTKDVTTWSRKLRSWSKFQLGQWQWQRMGWTRERGRVFLVSAMSDADARAGFCEPFQNLQTAVEAALRETRSNRILVVPEGPYVVTRAAR